MPEYTRVAGTADLPPGKMLRITVGGRAVILANVEGSIYAFAAYCTHEAAFLDEGYLQGHTVTCPLHFSSFDVRTGEVREPPAEEPLATYEVRVEGANVEVLVP